MTEMIPHTHRNRRNDGKNSDSRLALLVVVFSLLSMVTPKDGRAQFASLPQADSPEEFDAYLEVLSKTGPEEVILAAKEFEKNWPHSLLRGPVCQMELESYRSLNDPANAIEAGERALRFVPGNLAVLADLASIIADATTDPQQLNRAEKYARKMLEALGTFKVPKWMLPQEWKKTEGHLRSEAHAALGLVAYKRGEVAQAIHEFETATSVAPAPDPTQYHRLGLLYRATGKESAAIQMFRQAVKLGEPPIRGLAERELQTLEH
jgi:tetratricopeptide (TPR) repeat protein